MEWKRVKEGRMEWTIDKEGVEWKRVKEGRMEWTIDKERGGMEKS